jgi:hypothetical protein
VNDGTPHTLHIPCHIPSPHTLQMQVEGGLLYPHTLIRDPARPLLLSSLSLSKGIRGYEGIRSAVERQSFPHTLHIPYGGEGYEAAAQHSPGCALCGGSTIVISRPLPGGGYETCSRCLIPPGWPPTVHPAWRRHMRAACR